MSDPYEGTKVGLDGIRRDAESPDFPTEIPRRGGDLLTEDSPQTQVVNSLTDQLTRSADDAVVIIGDATVTSATAEFSAADVGAVVLGTHIPAGAVVASINSATSIELSAPAETGKRVYTDAVTVSGDATVTSATAAFTVADQGAAIAGTGIPGGATILLVNSPTSIELSANASSSGTGRTHTITPVGYDADVTIERDAATYIADLESRVAALEA